MVHNGSGENIIEGECCSFISAITNTVSLDDDSNDDGTTSYINSF